MKFCDATVAPLGSVTSSCTSPFVSVFAVHVTPAVTVVLTPWVTGLGDAVAEEENVGGAIGVAGSSVEFGPWPAEFVPETT